MATITAQAATNNAALTYAAAGVGGDTEIALPTTGQSATGNYGVTYSAVTSVTVTAINT
jgi:hypothetical protein